ncbi:MAG: hypothetical protein SOV27_01470 [Eubacteriales bacterium]|nr:hypothetical protein [Eubacteriales bacterium]
MQRNNGKTNNSDKTPYLAKYSKISLPEANPAPITAPIIINIVFKTFIKYMYDL